MNKVVLSLVLVLAAAEERGSGDCSFGNECIAFHFFAFPA